MQLLRSAYNRKFLSIKEKKAAASDHLHHLAFDNSLQANIISRVSDGKIIKANMATCKLLGYTKKELLAKNRKDIFDISESSYIKMIKKRTEEGNVKAEITLIKKNGKKLPCQITSVVFTGDNGLEKSITTVVDMSEDVLKQKKINTEKTGSESKLKVTQIANAVIEAQDQERCDIGKELHDNINQLLGVSRLYLEMGRKEGANKELYLARSSEYIMNAIEEIRKLTKGMITSVIKDIGLCEAISSIIKDTMEIYPIKIACKDNLIETRLNEKFKMNIFRILQEQLNNILKHAKATAVNITLSQHKKTIVLSMTDNGVGFNTSQKPKGIGIDNIKTRAAAYGGTADFASQPGKGCILTVTFPFTHALKKK
ncbi:MAG: PAS domain-containing protein [Chitinophagales bacterium]